MKRQRNLYILCGGKSRRMGSDKAQLALDGRFLIDILISRARPFFHEIILLSGGNTYHTQCRQLDDTVVAAGPLGGLMSALKDASGRGHSYLAMVPVDLPFFSKKSFQFLSESEPQIKVDAVIAKAGEEVQPLAGIFHIHLIPELDAYLSRKKRRVQGFVGGINHNLFLTDPKELLNVNTPAEYQKILSDRRDRLD